MNSTEQDLIFCQIDVQEYHLIYLITVKRRVSEPTFYFNGGPIPDLFYGKTVASLSILREKRKHALKNIIFNLFQTKCKNYNF